MCRDEHWNMGTLRVLGARTAAVRCVRGTEEGGRSRAGPVCREEGLREFTSSASWVCAFSVFSQPHPGPAHGSET